MTTPFNASFSQPTVSASDSLLLALFFAVVIHAFILLGINFTIPHPPKINRQIEITLSNTPAKKAPKKANYLAQDNQTGAGKINQKPAPPKQKLPSQGLSQNKPPSAVKSQIKSQPKAKQKLITQKRAKQKIATTRKQAPHSATPRPKLSPEALRQQIAQLGAKIRHSRQQSSEQTRIKFVNSVSTHKYVAAQYVKDWEEKIERVGNFNYPEVARKKGFSGTLTTDVGINPNGTIYSIRITKSSGNKALDDAAKRIIRLSAPFAILPKEILQQLDVLVITRVWRFSDETGITTR
jgi:protein TonB